ncbi:uncharacterized protein LOC105198340 isoform X2 [Solenopsis invicta]|uniref:uncharacterized protein LOC105198340 isoform X2 n=1 Tax=Solenopsis invicta TaxID=13686 RepID=UPI00193D62EC|nr:uncharacterized protein LOC105198340 isoform X2 [Solenopsis invicta]
MICTDSLNISLNRFLLLIVGLWPYQQNIFVWLQLILLIGILTSFILVQFTVFLTSKCTPVLFINVLSSALYYILYVIKYIFFSINTNNARCLLEQMQLIYNELTDENEINILKKYSNYTKYVTVVFSLCLMCIAPVSIVYLFWPYIFNILFSTNGTQSCSSLPFITEYFVDQQKYSCLISFHANAATCIGAIAVLAIGSIFLVYIYHACGMFCIASYRIKSAMPYETLRKNSLEYENLIYNRLIYAVDMHRKAMKFCNMIISRFQVMFCCMIVIGVISASLNMFQIFQMISHEYDIVELMLHSFFVNVHFLYLILGNYFAQEIIDHNNCVFVTAYNVQWYVAPLQIQKMILFLLQRGNKTFNLTIAGLFVGSLEGAATLFSSIISYFTVLYSTRN